MSSALFRSNLAVFRIFCELENRSKLSFIPTSYPRPTSCRSSAKIGDFKIGYDLKLQVQEIASQIKVKQLTVSYHLNYSNHFAALSPESQGDVIVRPLVCISHKFYLLLSSEIAKLSRDLVLAIRCSHSSQYHAFKRLCHQV